MEKVGYAAAAKVAIHQREYVVIIRPRDRRASQRWRKSRSGSRLLTPLPRKPPRGSAKRHSMF